jgi:hypothetical protein
MASGAPLTSISTAPQKHFPLSTAIVFVSPCMERTAQAVGAVVAQMSGYLFVMADYGNDAASELHDSASGACGA